MNWRSLGSPDWLTTKGKAAAVGKKVVPTAMCALLAVLGTQLVPACSTANPAAGAIGTGDDTSTTTAPDATATCDHPAPGCPCSKDTETAACGKVIVRSGDFFQCSEGTTTCDGTTWGACDGDIKASAHKFTGGGVGLAGLGHIQTCGKADPCDPYCNIIIDTPPGIDGGSTVATSEAGLVIAPPSNLNTCNEATTPGTLYANLPSAYQGNPSSCTSGTTGTATTSDDCNSDYVCQAGTCVPYAQGTRNPATTCTNQPDFTVGLGCWDNPTNAGLELEVCNRGGVTAGSTYGSLVVSVQKSDVAGPVLTGIGLNPLQCPLNSKQPTTILPVAGLTTAGTCTINLTSNPLGAGECTSFNVTSPPSGITCASNAGGVIDTTGPNIFAVVNPTVLLAGLKSSFISECDVCNNYTAINVASEPPANSGAGTCVSSWCGVVANSNSATGCPLSSPTTITGTVTDPAGNVGLSNVEVYITTDMSNPLAPLPDEPGGGATPTCDTCASLSGPGYLTGTSTDVNGSFTLYPTGTGPYTVVAQIGRWRRAVYSVQPQVCKPNPINTTTFKGAMGVISMPSTRTQGDIPKMALVQGSQESLECWLAKVGIATSEIAPYTTTATNRIQLYNSANGNGAVGQNYYNGTSSTPPSATTLWDTTLYNYSAIFMPCDGSSDYGGNNATATEKMRMTAYAHNGGRIFIDHWPGETWIENNTNDNWNSTNVATWSNNSDTPGTQTGTVLNAGSSSDEQAMYSWLAKWDGPAGSISSQTPRDIVTKVGAESVGLVTFPNLTGTPVASFWFNTPPAVPPATYCGRVVYNDMHVSASRGINGAGGCTTGNFPGNCNFPTNCDMTTPLTSEELALEYELFQLSACGLGTATPIPPPPPPAAPTISPVTFTRTVQANCQSGFTPRWGFFEWQATIPAGTSIAYSVQTAPDGTGGLPGTFGTAVSIGSATTTTPPMTYSMSGSVDTDLTMAGQSSKDWLQINMLLTPSGTVSPILTEWQMLYDCVP
jgi:hypothetical protein